LLLCVLFYGGNGVLAQLPANYSFQFYNTSHGLPSSQIIAMAKDNNGFLWLGTSVGISMYDGYSFKNYSHTTNNEMLGRVNVIKPGNNNRLWIGTGSGLFCYANNEIVKISAPSLLPQGINDILLEDDGTIWLATENGPSKINSKDADLTGNKKIILPDYLLKQWQQNKITHKSQAQLISKAPDGSIFIAVQNHLFLLADDKLQLLHIAANKRDKITTLFPVSKSLVYFDAISSELNKIENGIASSYNPEKLYQPNSKQQSPGNWYVGTRGVYYFHPQSGTVTAAIHLDDKYVVWPTAILKENNFLWVASQDGLIKLKPALFSTYEIKKASSYNDYYAVAELRNGKILLGANRGKIFEKKDSLFVLFKDKAVPDAEIKSIYEDERGWLWLATGYQGLVLIRNGRMERFTVENGLHDNTLTSFLRTKNGKMYVTGDVGISEIVVHTDNSVSFKKFILPANSTQHAKYFSAIEGPGESIWIAGEEGIAYLKNDSLHHFTFNGKQFAVNFLIKDNTGKVWIATSGDGILQALFNKQDKLEIVKQFTENDGLNSLHYLTLLADNENNIWAGSSKGISVIGEQGKYQNRISNFDETDGFIRSGYSYIRLLQDSKASIWGVTSFGFISFKPGELLLQGTAPVIYITAVQPAKENLLITGNNFQYPSKNEFSYSNNSLQFNFTAVDYVNPENIRYYYQLNGLDSNWINAGIQRSISFQNLSPGKYSFRVKALNSRGIWSKQEAVYSFKVVPPFWKTWWFIICAGSSIAGLLYFYIKRREKIVREKEQQNTEIQSLKASNYQYQFEMTQVINYFASSIHEQTTIDNLLWDVAKNCIAKLGFEDCVIYLKNNERNVLVQKAAWGPKTNNENKIVDPIEILPGRGIVGAVALSGKAVIVNDTSKDDRYIVDDALRLSEITIPIINNGEVIGIIDSEHPRKNFYTERHLQILTTIASLCADKMDKIKAEQQTREKELEVLKLNKDLATSQLTALRAQMNPHFIFNALNSVQHYILQGNVIEANKYLSKFSKLQREILNNSNQNFIALQKEMSMLNLYLELEQLRFAEKFTYHITKDDAIDEEEIKIPPMIIQPFIENAIWHGLMPKTGDRFVKVNFALPEEDQLICSITDNGIGREAALRLRNANSTEVQHQSKGLSLVYDRLDILQAQYGKPFKAVITDLTNDDGTSNGTRVTLTIYLDF
jgi:two-component system, LytTR family, sensor kinase